MPLDENSVVSESEKLLIEEMASNTLDGLTRSRSFFKKDYFIKSIKKKLDEDLVSKSNFDEMLDSIVQNLHIKEIDGQLDYSVITHGKLLHAEKEMLALAAFETDDHVLDKNLVQSAINKKEKISEEQIESVWSACISPRRVTVIEGTAGAGKSFTMEAVKEAYEASGYVVTGTALSWTAAKVLESSSGLQNCKAIEGLLREIENSRKSGIEYFRTPTVLIVDEAGLVGTMHMWRLLKETHDANVPVKVVLTGDSTQLAPVDAGNALEAIVEYCGATRIDTIRRQKQDSHRRAVKLFAAGEAGKALYTYQQQEAIKWFDNNEEVLKAVVQDFVSFKLAFPEKKALILALSNKDVQKLNNMVREIYKELGKVDSFEIKAKATDMRNSWSAAFAVGDQVVFRKNDKNKEITLKDSNGKVIGKNVGLFNRMHGTISKISKADRGWDIEVELADGTSSVSINTFQFADDKLGLPLCHNFATTIYASQGQTVQKVFMIDSDMMQRRLAYVGMSRHTENCDIYLDKENLTKRLDKLTGVVYKEGESVDINKYGGLEMLQAMANTWSKEAKNQTSLMMLKEKKTKYAGKKFKRHEDADELWEIKPDLDTKNVVDFIEDYNKFFPIVDVNKLLNEQNEHMTIEEVEVEVPVIPVKENIEDIPKIDKAKKQDLLSSVFGFLGVKPEKPPVASDDTKIINKVKKIIKTFNAEKNLGYIEYTSSPVIIKEHGQENEKTYEVVFLEDKLHPSMDFFASTKGELWDVGKNQEIRFLAKNKGTVLSRYDISGEDRTGFGFPMFIPNKSADHETPIFIVKEPLDMLYALEHFQKTKSEELNKMPHFVWAAKGADLGLLKNAFKRHRVVIARSKTDESQLGWALEFKEKLDSYGVESSILPKAPADEENKTMRFKK